MSKKKFPKIDVYTSIKNGAKHLSVAAGKDVTALVLPADIDSDLLTLSPFKTRIELDPAKTRTALNQEEVQRQIETNGFAIHGATHEIKVGSSTS